MTTPPVRRAKLQRAGPLHFGCVDRRSIQLRMCPHPGCRGGVIGVGVLPYIAAGFIVPSSAFGLRAVGGSVAAQASDE